jgi:hypothetical protein
LLAVPSENISNSANGAGTKGKDVKIGIEAPEDVEIWREEICEKILE